MSFRYFVSAAVLCFGIVFPWRVSAQLPPGEHYVEPNTQPGPQPSYEPTTDRPDPDTFHFPNGSDMETYEDSRENLLKFNDNLDIGIDIGKRYVSGHETDTPYQLPYEMWLRDVEERCPLIPDSGGILRYKRHPWKKSSACCLRDLLCSEDDWKKDTKKKILETTETSNQPSDKFFNCFEPRLVAPICSGCWPPAFWKDSSCNDLVFNLGYTFEFWWPEETIETNNFATSAFNPRDDVAGNLSRTTFRELVAQLDSEFRPDELKAFFERHGAIRVEPLTAQRMKAVGSSHSAELLPGDQVLNLESHIYQTEVGYNASKLSKRGTVKQCGNAYIKVETLVGDFCIPFNLLYNGYLKGNPDYCFYDTLDKGDQIISGWTEEPEFMPTWRIAELSRQAFPLLYRFGSPRQGVLPTPRSFVKDESYVATQSCGSFRIVNWPERYKDLDTAVKSTPQSPWTSEGIEPYQGQVINIGRHRLPLMELNCYFGGGQLYPIVQNLAGFYSPMPATSYLARRAIELISNPRVNTRGYPRRPPRYADVFDVDKLQRIAPGESSSCYRMNDVDERNYDLFPKDLEREQNKGDVRYVYWNKRTACVCPYRGVVPSWDDERPARDTCSSDIYFKPSNGMAGWGCLAGRDPGNLIRGSITGSGGFGDFPSKQSQDDFLIGRGDFFIGFNLGRPYSGSGFPDYTEAAEKLWNKEQWGAGKGLGVSRQTLQDQLCLPVQLPAQCPSGL